MVDFGKKKEKKSKNESSNAPQDITKKLVDLNERTRLLEERAKHSTERIRVVDETYMNKFKELQEELSGLREDVAKIREEMKENKNILRRLVKEIGNTAKLSDVKVLEKYINMIDITRLITKEDVVQIVREELSNKKKKKE